MMGLDRDRLIELVQVVVRNPLRAFLSALGVGWGLFMIIITVGAARGLENGVKADMGSDVSNSMFAWTMSTSIPYKGYQRGRWLELDIDDVKRHSHLASDGSASSCRRCRAILMLSRGLTRGITKTPLRTSSMLGWASRFGGSFSANIALQTD